MNYQKLRENKGNILPWLYKRRITDHVIYLRLYQETYYNVHQILVKIQCCKLQKHSSFCYFKAYT